MGFCQLEQPVPRHRSSVQVTAQPQTVFYFRLGARAQDSPHTNTPDHDPHTEHKAPEQDSGKQETGQLVFMLSQCEEGSSHRWPLNLLAMALGWEEPQGRDFVDLLEGRPRKRHPW